MRENFAFGGGAAGSTMTPVVLIAALLSAILVLILPRKIALVPLLVTTFLTPFGQQILAGGAHLFVIRLLILAGALRVLAAKISSKHPVFSSNVTVIERLFFWWALCRGLAYIMLWKEGGAVTSQMALWLDAYGGYLVFRYFIQDRVDIIRVLKVLAAVCAISGTCMLYEYTTRVNLFSYLNNYTLVPWIRDGKVRAQGVFANSITAGTFGATLAPLFYWLWRKDRNNKTAGLAGLIGATLIVLTSMASTAYSAYLAGLMALVLWPLRKNMRGVRWGIVACVAVLAVVMKAPVWFLVARIDFVGGHGWDRAYLIDQLMRHIPDWWLVGTKDNANWGSDTWDACNQFVAEGFQGGLTTLILFIALLSRAFGLIGRARKLVEGEPAREWYFWSLGAALFAHLISFMGIDYFDQTRIWWFIFLAMISASISRLKRPARGRRIITVVRRKPQPALAGVSRSMVDI